MREIKFRVWHPDEGNMYYFNCFKEITDWQADDFYRADNTDDACVDFMQFTGLHDENGKEIYEGDIIEFSYDMFVGNFDTFVAKGKVVFEEGAFYVEAFENERTTEGEAYLLYSINLDTIEVIGNIYENKELLNETNK